MYHMCLDTQVHQQTSRRCSRLDLTTLVEYLYIYIYKKYIYTFSLPGAAKIGTGCCDYTPSPLVENYMI